LRQSGATSSGSQQPGVLKAKDEEDPDDEHSDPGDANKKKRKTTNVDDESARQYGKWSRELPKLRENFSKEVDLLVDILSDTKHEENSVEDFEFKSYRDSALFRLRLGKVFVCSFASLVRESVIACCFCFYERLEALDKGCVGRWARQWLHRGSGQDGKDSLQNLSSLADPAEIWFKSLACPVGSLLNPICIRMSSQGLSASIQRALQVVIYI